MTEAAMEVEGEEGLALWDKIHADLTQQLLGAGTEIIDWSDADNKQALNTFRDVMWKELLNLFPDEAPRFKEMIGPK